MRIGILTLPFNNNYGGYLQAFALMTVLKSLNHDVELIYRRQNRKSFIDFTITFFKNIVKLCLGRQVHPVLPTQERVLAYNGAKMYLFANKYIFPKSRPFYDSKKMNWYIDETYDAVIVGSDQVWRPEYVPCIRDYFFCSINDRIRKIAYAASFGCSNPFFCEEERQLCGDAIERFYAVGLREKNGTEIIKKMGWNCKTRWVLDPTMLLSADVYKEIAGKETACDEKEVLLYVLDDSEQKKDLLKEICDRVGLKEKYIMDPILWKRSDYQMPSVEEWLRGFLSSELIVTDSFHGTVFSILFNRPFWVIVNKKRGADRFESLLSLLGLEDRMIAGVEEMEKKMKKEINWEVVNEKVCKKRLESFEFLKQALC